jgi:hypothetical protein
MFLCNKCKEHCKNLEKVDNHVDLLDSWPYILLEMCFNYHIKKLIDVDLKLFNTFFEAHKEQIKIFMKRSNLLIIKSLKASFEMENSLDEDVMIIKYILAYLGCQENLLLKQYKVICILYFLKLINFFTHQI